MQSQNQIILHLYFIINQKRKYKLKFEFNRWLTGFTIVRYRIKFAFTFPASSHSSFCNESNHEISEINFRVATNAIGINRKQCVYTIYFREPCIRITVSIVRLITLAQRKWQYSLESLDLIFLLAPFIFHDRSIKGPSKINYYN